MISKTGFAYIQWHVGFGHNKTYEVYQNSDVRSWFNIGTVSRHPVRNNIWFAYKKDQFIGRYSSRLAASQALARLSQ